MRVAKQRRDCGGVRNPDYMRRCEAVEYLLGEARQLEVSTQPACADFQSFRHSLLIALVKPVHGPGIVGGTFVVRQITTRSVLEIRKAKRLFVSQLPRLNDELEIWIVMGAQPANAPMPARPAHDLKTVQWIV